MRLIAVLLVGGCLACGSDEVAPVIDGPTPECVQSCMGCCAGGRCLDGNQQAACGTAGSACVQCRGAESCETGADGSRRCVLDPSALWRVQPTSADISELDASDEAWDLDGSPPDIVVRLECPSADGAITSETPEQEGFTPEWTDGGCTTTLHALLSRPVEITVVDIDFGLNDVLEATSHQLVQEDFRSGVFSLDLPAEQGMVRFQLERRP